MSTDGNNCEQEIIYANDTYRVELLGIKVEGGDPISIYGVFNITHNVLEVETNILAKALNSADELEVAVNKFFQDKTFDNLGSAKKLIETA